LDETADPKSNRKAKTRNQKPETRNQKPWRLRLVS
jgi:hypothetical protein